MQTDETLDILVLGAGPAGAAAALLAAKQGLAVAVLERDARSPEGTWLEWLHPGAHGLLDAAGVSSRDAVRGTIDRVRFLDLAHDRDAVGSIDVKIDVVDTLWLTEAVLAAARAAGARLITEADVTAIRTSERAVTLTTASGMHISGRLLIAADGYDSLAVRSFGLDTDRAAAPSESCQSVVPYPDAPTEDGGAGGVTLNWILTSVDHTSFGYLFAVGGRLVVGFVAPARAGGVNEQFDRMLPQWRAAGLLPQGLDVRHAETVVRRIPRGVALEMETHVAKLGLAVGDAGGFVAAVSNEGLYPAIWSASLAASVCAAALDAPHPQDILAEFDSRWRREMVEYLRLPNADPRFLLPLIFTNDRMARRLANALLGGGNV